MLTKMQCPCFWFFGNGGIFMPAKRAPRDTYPDGYGNRMMIHGLKMLAACSIGIAVMVATVACAGAASEPVPVSTLHPTYTPYPTLTSVPTATAYPTYTPQPTLEPLPTYTPYPTNTPYPTHTVVPTATVPPAPTPTRTLIPTMPARATRTPVPTAHAKIRAALGCSDCKLVVPRATDVERFVEWPSPSIHKDPFVVAACGRAQSLGNKGIYQVVGLSTGKGRATVGNTLLIKTTKTIPEGQCVASLTKYLKITPVEWTTQAGPNSVGIWQWAETYAVDHITFARPTETLEISTSDFSSLYRQEAP